MTIEQILEILENYKLRIPPTVFYDLKADIVNFEEPTTENDLGVDCISRESVLKLIYDYKENHSNDREHYPINYGTLLDMIRWVRNLPSVTPQEPRKGHWIYVGEENEEETKLGNFRYVCSECGFTDVHGKSIYVPYCWQCGAKMAEPEESEEV